MNRLFFFFTLLAACSANKKSVQYSADDYRQKFNFSEVVGVTDDPARFPEPDRWAMYHEGQKGLNRDIFKNISELENKGQGRVVLRYVVGRDGYIGRILVKNSSKASIEKPAIEALRNTNRWIPAIRKGQAIDALYETSIFFGTP